MARNFVFRLQFFPCRVIMNDIIGFCVSVLRAGSGGWNIMGRRDAVMIIGKSLFKKQWFWTNGFKIKLFSG
jgi:hypothetical protein